MTVEVAPGYRPWTVRLLADNHALEPYSEATDFKPVAVNLMEDIVSMNRRDFVGASSASALVTAALGSQGVKAESADNTGPGTPAKKIRRIATEEAWSIPEHLDGEAAIARSVWNNLDVEMHRPRPETPHGVHPRAKGPSHGLFDRLCDPAASRHTDNERLKQMDELDIDMHVLSLTSPGVQLFDANTAVSMAALANDRMAEIVHSRPTRFAGLASFAPQDPSRAAKEMDRAINKLGLNGFIVNSSTDNEYLDDHKFWEIFEAAEALDAAIYIHPRCPSDGMAQPFRGYDMGAALWGFACETGTHAVRLMLSGVFDRFPKLKIVLGHMGENIPYHLWRTDHWMVRRRHDYPSKLTPQEIFRRNFFITTSGLGQFEPADELECCKNVLKYCIDTFGADHIMWAIDYPYEEMPPAVEFMNKVEIADADREKIYHGTAERVFHVSAVA